jgi:hypothetical protein
MLQNDTVLKWYIVIKCVQNGMLKTLQLKRYITKWYTDIMVCYQEAKYVERWPNTTSAWAGWSRFDIPVDRYGRVRSQLISTSMTLGSSTCHQASQQGNTY